MSGFKKGDSVIVRDIGGGAGQRPYIGALGTVADDDTKFPSVRFSDGVAVNFRADRLELVSPAVQGRLMQGLAELVHIANAGYRAVDELSRNHRDAVELKSDRTSGVYMPPSWDASPPNREFRIKPKAPVFEPFQIGSWHVDLKGDRISIGCKSFDAVNLQHALNSLNTQGGKVAMPEGYMSAHRNGVRYDGHDMTWASVDKLLAALAKAGIK